MLTQYQPNKDSISRQKATVIKITVLICYAASDLPWTENLEFIFRYNVAFSPGNKELYICSFLKS